MKDGYRKLSQGWLRMRGIARQRENTLPKLVEFLTRNFKRIMDE